jgi:hypothetical protein
VLALVAACGDKVPESEAARKIGQQPKAIVDKTTTDVNKALQQGADSRRDAEEKK